MIDVNVTPITQQVDVNITTDDISCDVVIDVNTVTIDVDVDPAIAVNKGDKGDEGDSAYQVAVNNGFVGTEQEWLDSLQGSDGQDGQDGQDGESAYQIWLDEGNTGTEQDFLDSLKGDKGDKGDTGDNGQGVPIGGEKNQFLFKNSSTDFDTSFKYCWFDYLIGVKYTNTNTSISGGTVREANFRGDIVYRYTTNSFTGLYPTVDAFYSSFNGINVTNKIVEKGD